MNKASIGNPRPHPQPLGRGIITSFDLASLRLLINTVTKMLVDAGEVCAIVHDEKVRGVKAKRVQCDEIWSFTYAKQKNVA